ncbi:MAG: dockerin type I repeat-containing protein [Clostridia bacterium]|nr:dockerin type I repeat-containing protein [Clostridia bacterium]
MKKSTKFISVILALVMIVSVIPLSASGSAINTSTYNTVEKLISNNGLYSVVDYLVNKLNGVNNDAIGSVLKLVYMFMNNDDVNALIGDRDITALSNNDAAKVLVNWLDTKILPELNAKLADNSVIETINNNIPGLKVDLGSVQGVYDTLAQLDDFGISALLYLLGDAKDLNVSCMNNVKVSGNELNAVKVLFTFLKDNLGVVRKALNGELSLGVLDSFVGDYLEPITQLNLLLKSALYKLIDSEAAVGKFGKGEMAGDWGKSAYASYTADELLASALIKLINKYENGTVIAKSEADETLNLSFYGILAKFAPVLYKNFAISFLNDNIQSLVDKLSDVDPELRAQFKDTIPTFDENTFKEFFDGAQAEGFLGQLNNILVKIAELVLAPATFNDVALVKGDNTNLNANITKFCRYTLPLLFKIEGKMNYTFPQEIKDNYKTLSLSDMAVYVLKPFFGSWFDNSSDVAIDSADSLGDLAVLAVYYTATNDWMTLKYDFSAIAAEIFDASGKLNKFNNDECTKLVLKTGAGIGIGALQQNAEKLHFNVTVDNSNWETAVNQISNWALDFIKGLPAVTLTHNIRNQNEYGPFYKLNVLVNELINFSFLNNVNDATFKLDLYTLLTDSILGNAYEFDIEGVIGIFEKNSNSDNILSGKFVPSVLGVVDRIVTALFEHTCSRTTATETVPAEGNKQCTHTVTSNYDYCKTCGAYFSKTTKENKLDKSAYTHEYKTVSTEQVTVAGSTTTCKIQTKTTQECQKCGDVVVTTTTAAHKNTKVGNDIPATCGAPGKRQLKCSVCGYEQTLELSSQPATGKHTWDNGTVTKAPTTTATGIKTFKCKVCGATKTETIAKLPSGPSYKLGDVDKDGSVTASDARLALRQAVKLENFKAGSAEFLACDVDNDGNVTASDARIILRVAVKLENIASYEK